MRSASTSTFHDEEQTENERLSIALAQDLLADDHDPWPALPSKVPDPNAPTILTEQKLQTGKMPVFQRPDRPTSTGLLVEAGGFSGTTRLGACASAGTGSPEHGLSV